MTRKITATGKEVTVGTPSKDITVSVSVPIVNAFAYSAVVSTPATREEQLDVVLKGLGEEAVPDTNKFKYHNDTPRIVEQISKRLEKSPFTDSSSTQDAFTLLVSKPLSSIAGIADWLQCVASWHRSYSDVAVQSDVVELGVGRNILEPLRPIETISKGVSKPIEISIALHETIAKTLHQTYADQTTATDDIFGEANVDDDQTVSFFKVLEDRQFVSDTQEIIVDFKRSVDDVGTTSDSVVKRSDKSLIDATSVGDTLEGFQIYVQILEELYFASDYTEPGYVYGAPKAYDTISLSPSKGLHDYRSAQDSSFVAPILVKNSFATIGEERTAFLQNYFAEDYANVYYVGTYYPI